MGHPRLKFGSPFLKYILIFHFLSVYVFEYGRFSCYRGPGGGHGERGQRRGVAGPGGPKKAGERPEKGRGHHEQNQ